MDNLEEDLTCSVCYSLFTDPRVLPCSHTFCKSCLESVLQASVNFSIWRPLRLPLKCPSCRSVAELPTNGVDALPVNVCLRAIVEKYQRDSPPRSPACPEHPPQPLNVYCLQDRKLICGFCLTVGQHQGHAIDDLQAAYVRERAGQPRLMESLRGERWEDVCSLAQRLQQEKLRSEAWVQNDREVASRFFQGLDLTLAQKKEQFMQALDRASVLLACAYDPLLQQLKDMQEEHRDLTALSSGLESEECPLGYLEKVHQLRERVEALSRTPLPEIPSLHMTPRAEPFLQEHWSDVPIRGLSDAPLPEISCHAQRCTPAAGLCSSSAAVLMMSLLILGLTALCLHPSAPVFPALSGSDDAGSFFFCLLHSALMKLNTCVSALGENTYQHLLRLL